MNVRILLLSLSLILAGCAHTPQQSVPLSPAAFSDSSGKLGIAMAPLPKSDSQFPGANCLLCYAAAAAGNTTLTNYIETLPQDDLAQLKEQIAAVLKQKGSDVTVISDNVDIGALPDYGTEGPNIAPKDYTSFKTKYNIDRLLVININHIGIVRPYALYVPTSDPKVVIGGFAGIVNLSNNTYEWYRPMLVTKSSDNVWDEPPKFPGLTNAYFQAVEIIKDSVLAPFNATGEQPMNQAAEKGVIAIAVPSDTPTVPMGEKSSDASVAPTVNPIAEKSLAVAVEQPAVVVEQPVTQAVEISSAATVVPPANPVAEKSTTAIVEQPVTQAAPTLETSTLPPVEPDHGSAAPIVLAKEEFKLGQSSSTVERMAKQQTCETDRGAGLLMHDGPVEEYRVNCVDGRELNARCEFRQCTFISQK